MVSIYLTKDSKRNRKYNIDHNATKHYHGTSMSIFFNFQPLKTLVNHSVNTWAQHNASKQRTKVQLCDITVILPLTDDVVHTLDLQYHLMLMISKITQILNKNQISVDVAE